MSLRAYTRGGGNRTSGEYHRADLQIQSGIQRRCLTRRNAKDVFVCIKFPRSRRARTSPFYFDHVRLKETVRQKDVEVVISFKRDLDVA